MTSRIAFVVPDRYPRVACSPDYIRFKGDTMKYLSTLLKCLSAVAITGGLGACAVVPADGGYGYPVQGQVVISAPPVYMHSPAVVVRPSPFFLGHGWGRSGGHRGYEGGNRGHDGRGRDRRH